MSTQQVFFDGHQAVDAVTPAGLGLYSRMTQAELEKQYGQLKIISLDEAAQRVEMAACSEPVEVDQETWDEAFCMLPPLKWVMHPDVESFRGLEPYCGTVHTSFVRIGKRFFKLRRPLSDSHEQLVGAVTIAMVTKSRKR